MKELIKKVVMSVFCCIDSVVSRRASASAPVRPRPSVLAVALTSALALGSHRADAGVIDNGDFEDSPALQYWSVANGVTGVSNDSANAESGLGYAVFTGSSEALYANSANGASPIAYDTYTVDFWLKNYNSNNGDFTVGFVASTSVIPQSGDPGYGGYVNSLGAVFGGLTKVNTATVNGYQEYQFTATSTSSNPILAFATDGNMNGDYYFDNVSATAASAAVPEPASLVLWAAGLVGLSKLRKRARRVLA